MPVIHRHVTAVISSPTPEAPAKPTSRERLEAALLIFVGVGVASAFGVLLGLYLAVHK